MRSLLLSCACLSAALLPAGGAAAAEPLSPAELAVQLQPVRLLGGHAAFRTEHCRVLVLQAGGKGENVLLVQPEGWEHSARVDRVVERLSDLIFDGAAEPPVVLTAGDGKLVLPQQLRERMQEADCLGGTGVQALVCLISSGDFPAVSLNERGRVVLRVSDAESDTGLMFYPAVQKLEVLEVVGRLSGRSEVAAITEVLGYGDDASRSTHERLSRNLGCRVLFYNADDEALMAEKRGHVYVGQRDVVRKVLAGSKLPRAVMRFPEEMAVLPKPVPPPPPPMPGAAEALDSYLKFLREL